MRRGNNGGGIDSNALPVIQGQMPQKFDIAFRPTNRRIGQAQNGKAQLLHKGKEIVQNLLMDRRIPDNTLFAKVFLSGLKLGLDQAKHLSPARL